MSVDIQHAHQLLDQLGPGQLAVVVPLLEAMIRDEVDELSEEDRRAVAASREYFRQGGEGLSLEKIAAECGLSMDQMRGPKGG